MSDVVVTIDVTSTGESAGLANQLGGFETHTPIGADPYIDNQYDAFKHAYASAVFTDKFGDLGSKIGMDSHEFFGPINTPQQTNMDKFNNNVGREEYHRWKEAKDNGLTDIPLEKWIYDRVNEGKTINDPYSPDETRQWSESSIWDKIKDVFNDLVNSADKYRPPVRYDPLTIDLDGDGLETVGTSAGILFDPTGSGVKTGTGWVKPDDGFLVLDKNGNGLIDNGRELFGDSTIKSNGQLALDGFDALRDLDSNADGKVDVSDAQFNNLKVWRDLNQDGTTQNGELFTLGQLNIASINTGSTANSQTLPDGNQIADLGTYTRTDGSSGTTGEVTGNLGDINLAQDTFHRQFTTHPDTSAVASLPDMRGSGAVRDLREAASQSPALATTLGQLGGNTTHADLKAAVGVILQQWADGATFTDSFEAAAALNKDLFFIPPGVSALDAYNAHYHGLLSTYYASTNGGTPSSVALTATQHGFLIKTLLA